MDKNPQLQSNDARTITQVLAGDKQAYGTLIQRHWKLALAVAYTRCNDATAAEDIAQNSFIKAYSNLSTLRDPSLFAGWLTRIIHQECITYYRQEKKTAVKIYSIEQSHSVIVAASNPGLSSEQINGVHRAISKLPEHLQDVVLMRFVGGLPLKHIAEQIGKKYSTVRVWLHRAYKLLKDDLAPILEEVQS